MLGHSPKPCIAGCVSKVTSAFFVLVITVAACAYSEASLQVQEQAPQGTVGITYNTVLTVTGGTSPYSFSGSGLPGGLTVSKTAGSITGTPTASGTFPVTVTVTDSGSNQVKSNFSIIIAASGTVSVTVSPEGGALESGQQLQFKATVYNSGNQGVTWTASNGTISGNGLYTAPQVDSGTWTYKVTATSSADTKKSASVFVVVTPLVIPLKITTNSLPEAMAGQAYTETFGCTGGKSPYHWKQTSGTLPQGLKFTGSTGVLAGTTAQTGSYDLTFQVTDSSWPTQLTASASYVFAVSSVLEITTTLLPQITAGSSYSASATGVGGIEPYSWSVTSGKLPSGISLGGSTGDFAGTTSQTGNFTFTVKLADSSTPPQTTTQSLSVTVVGAQSTVADFYVATDGRDTWSGTLSAPNSNNTDGPFATLGRAQTAVQGILQNPKGRTNPIQVMVRAGSYYVTQPLSFSTADSGTSTLGVVWENYPNEAPVIDGGMKITNWVHNSGNEWQATLPSSTQYFEQMFYNGQRRLRPRLGVYLGTYYRVAATVYLPGSPNGPAPDPNCTVYMSGLGWECFDRFQYTKTDPINANWENLSPPYPQGDIELYDFEKWDTSILRVKSIDTGSNIIYLTGPTYQQDYYHGFIVGHRYVLENIKDELTQAGQWFLDRSRTPWVLTYIANSGENPPTDTVIVPQSTQVLVATGLQYVTFQGITFEHDDWTIPSIGYPSITEDPNIPGAVACYNCQYVTVNGVIVTQTQGGGWEFYTTSTSATTAHNTIENSAFYDVGGFALRIGSLAAYNDTDANVAQFTTVQNNVISGFGRIEPGAHGILQGDGHDNTYTHNDIYDGYEGGIKICALGCIPGHANSHGSFNNIASYNHVYNLGQGIMDDLGGVYFNTDPNATGNQALNNKIHDVSDASALDADGYGGQGVYLDANTANALVENNLVYRVSAATESETCGPQTPNTTNTIKNNIFAYGRQGIKQEGCVPPGNDVLQFSFTNNLIYYDRGYVQTGMAYCNGGPCTEVMKYADNMYCYAPGQACALPTNPFYTTGPQGRSQSQYYSSLSNWQSATGEDSGSVVKNPGFANPVYPNDDYSLSESPGVGFVVFDPNEAGRSNPIIPGPTVIPTFVTAPFNPATDF
ncbi:MAG TPA: putative Ig domain-containing protein [Candidatus Sulfotelmatobacter sp.]